MSLKKQLGRLIPYPLIERGRRVVHYGPRSCEICGARTRSRLDSGYGFPVLEQLQVVGGMKRRRDLCPICHSGARERLIWFYLIRHHPAFRGAAPPLRVAHFAPEKGLSAWFARRFGAGYAAYDFAPSRYRHLTARFQNLEGLTLPDRSVDFLVCNHVMEHVFDLPKALSEIARVLAEDGRAIMQVPIALALDATLDGGEAMSGPERIAAFGQDDHVRLFSEGGYAAALAQAGLAVERYDAFADDAAAATAAELDPFERLLVVRLRGSA